MTLNNILIFGGTFDPIHYGHLNVALDIQKSFAFDKFIFLPCKQSLLKKSPNVMTKHRITMIKLALRELALQKNNNFFIDLHEIMRNTPSYMALTLKNYRQLYGKNIAITLMMGSDSFNQLPLWEEWDKFLTLVNLLIINRPGHNLLLEDNLKDLYFKHETQNYLQLLTTAHGLIYKFDGGEYDISSTVIRENFVNKISIMDKLPLSVYQYIKNNKLYSINA